MELEKRIMEHEDRIVNLEKKLLKVRVLFEMTDIVKKAEKEYNALRGELGENYPKGKCKNILTLFQTLDKILDIK